MLRYETRCWRNGVIPDVDEAVDSPQRLTNNPAIAQTILERVPDVPTPVWGRDELRAGEMWNSNSLISWLLVRSGLGDEAAHPPAGGRAPGWRAGLVVAGRSHSLPDNVLKGELRASNAGKSDNLHESHVALARRDTDPACREVGDDLRRIATI
jgi:hypothetical protein